LVLIDADANLPARLDPIEIDPPRATVRGSDLSEAKGDVAHLVHVRTADAILHRPSHWRPELQWNGTADRAGEILLEHTFELPAEPLAGRDILRNDDELTEEIVGKFDIERQIKSDRAASDIGAPFLDIRILAEDLIELGRVIAAGVDRRVLRKPEIDEKLRPVRRRKELPRHMGKGEER